MKNKVLVAMGIGVAAAMVPAVASTADVIDLENLTQEQIDTIEKIEEAEASQEQEEVKLNDDDDYDDFAEVHLVPDAAPIQEGSLSAGSEDKVNPVHYADVVFTDNEEEVIHELTPAAFPSAIPTQAPVRPVITASPVPSSSASPAPSSTPMVTEVPMPSTAPAVEATAVAANSAGLVMMNPTVDMDASKKAELKAEELKNAGFEDVNINKEEEYRLPGSMGLDGDDKPQLTKDQLVNALIMMKNVMGGFEDLTPYSDDDLKAMDDDELMALNDKFKNIQIFQAVENPEVKDTDDKVILSGNFKNKEDRDSALVDLREAGYAPFKNMSDEQIAALTDEQLIAMGISATTEEYESEISVEAATGLTKAQLIEKLVELKSAESSEDDDESGYDALSDENIRAALKAKGLLDDDQAVPSIESMTEEQLLALSLKLGITRTTDPIDPTKTQDIVDATRDSLISKLGQLKTAGYEGLANVNIYGLMQLSNEDLVDVINNIDGLSDASFEVKNLVQTLANADDRLHFSNQHNDTDTYDYIAVTLTNSDGSTYTRYLKIAKVKDSVVGKDGSQYTVTSKGLVTTTLEDVDKSLFEVGSFYYDENGNQYVITKIVEAQAAVQGKVINKEAYDALSEEAKAAYSYNGKSLWISRVHFEDRYGNKVSEETYQNNKDKYHVVLTPIVSKDFNLTTKITLNDIDDYNVIALTKDGYSTSSNNSQTGVTVYSGTDSDTNAYFAAYYEMLLDAAGKMKSALLDKNNNLKTGNAVTDKIYDSYKDGTKFVKVSEGPNWNYQSNFDPTGYDVPVYYVTSNNGTAKIYGNEKNNGNSVNPLKAVYVMAENITEVLVKGINGVIVAPNAKIICDSTMSGKTITGTLIGKEVVNTNNIKLKKGLIDIVGQEVDTYKSQSQEASYNVELVSYNVNANRTLFDVTVADQVSIFSLAPETQAAKYIYGFTAPEQPATYRYGVKGDEVFYKYTVSGHRTTTTSYYGEAVVTAPPVAPPPTDDDIITTTFVYGAPDDVADDFVAAPVSAVLGANRPVEVEGTVLGAQRSGSVLGERRPQGAVLGKRRSPKTADAAMGGMIAGMMLSMMTAFGGATVLKKKREDEE